MSVSAGVLMPFLFQGMFLLLMISSPCLIVEVTMDHLLELSKTAKGVASSSEVSGFDSISASLVVESQPDSVLNETEGQYSAETKSLKWSEESEKPSEDLVFMVQNSFRKHDLNSEFKGLQNDQISAHLSLAVDHGSSSCFEVLPECAKSSWDYNAAPSSQQMRADNEIFPPALNPNCYNVYEPVLKTSGIHIRDATLDVAISVQTPEICSLPEIALASPEIIVPAIMEMPYANPSQMQNVGLDYTETNGMPLQLCQELSESETSAFDSFTSRNVEKLLLCNDSKNVSNPDLCPGFNFRLPHLANVDQFQESWNSHFSMLQEPVQNLMFPVCYPQSKGHTFVTPVAISPGQRRPTNCPRFGKIPPTTFQCGDSKLPLLKALGNEKESHNLNQLPGCRMMRRKSIFTGHVLVLLRGVPGSGKTFLSR